MKVEFINPFLSATLEVLKTMAFTEATPGKAYLKKNHNASGEVSGIIGIIGQASGSLSVTFSRACILHLVSSMLGEEITEVNEEIKDAVGELTNMIYGLARRTLRAMGYQFQASIPTVVSGPGHQVKHLSKGPTIAIPFKTAAGSFTVEVSFQS